MIYALVRQNWIELGVIYMPKQKLLVSVRGTKEALIAYKGGAHIIDVEYPASALGTPYPLNIRAIRSVIPKHIPVATNIGEEQQERRSTACQAALGVACAGADIIKAGLANYNYNDAEYVGGSIVRTVKTWFPKKKVIPAVFADKDLVKIFDPIIDGPKLGSRIKADGILIDTFNKKMKSNKLVQLLSVEDISKFVKKCHSYGIEAWIAGSISLEEMPELWSTGVDVICVRGAACEKGSGRMAKINKEKVRALVKTITF